MRNSRQRGYLALLIDARGFYSTLIGGGILGLLRMLLEMDVAVAKKKSQYSRQSVLMFLRIAAKGPNSTE